MAKNNQFSSPDVDKSPHFANRRAPDGIPDAQDGFRREQVGMPETQDGDRRAPNGIPDDRDGFRREEVGMPGTQDGDRREAEGMSNAQDENFRSPGGTPELRNAFCLIFSQALNQASDAASRIPDVSNRNSPACQPRAPRANCPLACKKLA